MIGEYERLEIEKAFWKGAKIESTFRGRNKWEEARPTIFVWSVFDYRIKK
jgi:hypothetical protein